MPNITKLTQKEVFVFGANASGFHGAGAAGFAFKGSAGNDWRNNPQFQKALKALDKKNYKSGYDPQDLIGKWAVLGENGLQRGQEGKSYGLITTESPGTQGKVNTEFLKNEIKKFFEVAKQNQELTFLCSNFGLKRPDGFSWWSKKEIKEIWDSLGETPSNIVPPDYISQELPKKTQRSIPLFGSLD